MSRNALLRTAARSRGHACPSCSLRSSRHAARWIHSTTRARKSRGKEEFHQHAEKIRAGQAKSMLSILEERGYVKEIAGDRNALDDLFTSKRIGAYAGIDPTAPSLHLGHLLPLMVLYWLYVHGYHVVSLVRDDTSSVAELSLPCTDWRRNCQGRRPNRPPYFTRQCARISTSNQPRIHAHADEKVVGER